LDQFKLVHSVSKARQVQAGLLKVPASKENSIQFRIDEFKTVEKRPLVEASKLSYTL